MKKNKKSKLSSFAKDKLNISNKEKEILESYKDIETDINNIEEYTIEEYITENSSLNEIEEYEETELSLDNEIEEPAKNKSKKERKNKANRNKSNSQEEKNETNQELEEFQVDEAKTIEQTEEEEKPKKGKKLKRAKKEKKPKKIKVKEETEDYEFEMDSDSEENDESNLEEFDIEEYDEISNINDEDDDNINNNQETNNNTSMKKKRKISINLLINIFYAIVILLILLSVIDIVIVTRYEKGPYFSIAVKTYDDGGTKEYYGLGYKVIKYNQVLGRKDIELGTWGLKYNIDPIYLDAIDLAIEINKDEAGTYNKYYKKFMRISGILQKVDMNNNTITISYIDDGGKYNVDIICNMEQGQDIISQFEVNNEITVLGTMNNYKFKSKDNNPTIEMKNCFAEQ